MKNNDKVFSEIQLEGQKKNQDFFDKYEKYVQNKYKKRKNKVVD